VLANSTTNFLGGGGGGGGGCSLLIFAAAAASVSASEDGSSTATLARSSSRRARKSSRNGLRHASSMIVVLQAVRLVAIAEQRCERCMMRPCSIPIALPPWRPPSLHQREHWQPRAVFRASHDCSTARARSGKGALACPPCAQRALP